MGGSGGKFGVMDPWEAILVKQTMRGCFQECMGCEAKSEFKMSGHDWNMQDNRGFLASGAMEQTDILYILEDSSFCQRCCLKDGRAAVMNVTSGGEAGGDKVFAFHKDVGCPVTFPIYCPKGGGDDDGGGGGGGMTKCDVPCCCMLPAFIGKDVDDEPFSESRYVCDQNLYVPKFDYMENGEVIYRLAPPTCCGGCCIACECKARGCNAAIPFYFYKPGTDERIEDGSSNVGDMPQITQVWAGFKKECCSTADTYTVKFPAEANGQRKAGLLGMAMLIDFAWFEGHSSEP
jgi:hypothetical protein